MSENSDTKEKIAKTAHELFSKFGFSGTSIRDIAQASGVNIAAINYHFGSKSNLYWDIVYNSHCQGNEKLCQLAANATSVEDMVVSMYDFFITEKAGVRTAIRMMMTEGVPEPEGEIRASMQLRVGPPGMEAIASVLAREIKEDVSEAASQFIVKGVFFHLFNIVMAKSSAKSDFLEKENPEFLDEAIHVHLRLHARALLEYIKNHPEVFADSKK